MKIFKILIGLVIGLSLAWGVLLFSKAKKSKDMQANVGIIEGKLKVCGEKPNCISSFSDKSSPSFYPPIETSTIEATWDDLNILLPDMGFNIVQASPNYIHATATTKLMGFVDDMEFLLNSNEGKIDVRSQSRVGYSDMGANKKRMNKITKKLLGSKQ